MGVALTIGNTPTQIPIDSSQGSTILNTGTVAVLLAQQAHGDTQLDPSTTVSLNPGGTLYWNHPTCYATSSTTTTPSTVYVLPGQSFYFSPTNVSGNLQLTGVFSNATGSFEVFPLKGTFTIYALSISVACLAASPAYVSASLDQPYGYTLLSAYAVGFESSNVSLTLPGYTMIDQGLNFDVYATPSGTSLQTSTEIYYLGPPE